MAPHLVSEPLVLQLELLAGRLQCSILSCWVLGILLWFVVSRKEQLLNSCHGRKSVRELLLEVDFGAGLGP